MTLSLYFKFNNRNNEMNDNNVLVSPFKTVYLFLMIMCGNYSPEEQNCILIKSKHFQFFAATFT